MAIALAVGIIIIRIIYIITLIYCIRKAFKCKDEQNYYEAFWYLVIVFLMLIC